MRHWFGDTFWALVGFGAVVLIDGVLAILTIGWFQWLGWWEAPPPPEPEAFVPIAGRGLRKLASVFERSRGLLPCTQIR